MNVTPPPHTHTHTHTHARPPEVGPHGRLCGGRGRGGPLHEVALAAVAAGAPEALQAYGTPHIARPWRAWGSQWLMCTVLVSGMRYPIRLVRRKRHARKTRQSRHHTDRCKLQCLVTPLSPVPAPPSSRTGRQWQKPPLQAPRPPQSGLNQQASLLSTWGGVCVCGAGRRRKERSKGRQGTSEQRER